MRIGNRLSTFASVLVAATAALAQTSSAPVAATAATVVPALVPYTGSALDGEGKAVAGEKAATFLLFKEEQGGEPLWSESQTIALDAAGRYQVQLGATSPSGLPLTTFASGEARWLEVQIAGEKPSARVLLMSVPYAMKAADAGTLGGLPASAFALAGSPSAAIAQTAPASVTPDGTSNVTTTGGSSGYIPKFTGASTVVNSEIYDTGTSVGIGKEPSAGIQLDVNGAMIMRGNMQVTRTGNATSSKAYPSYGFQFYSNLYNSSTKAADNPYYQLQSEPTGNNTSSPSATFNLLFANNGNAVAETGLYFNPNGTIHFASGQTFPGAGGGITGVTASSPLTGGGTSGNVTIGLSTSSLESSLNSFYARLASANNFTSSATFAGPITGNSGNTMYAIQGNTSSGFGVEGMATGNDGYGVDGYTTGNGGVGVYGNSDGGADSNGNYPIGVLAHALQGTGVKSTVDEPMDGYAAVLGLDGGGSGTYSFVHDYYSVAAGVWGDAVDNTNISVPAGIIGTADEGIAGYFINESSNESTVYAENLEDGTSGTLFKTLMASSPKGTCGFSSGNMTCTGQVKSLATTASGEHKVETYAMQSPENWMEDFGTGELRGGSGSVTLEATFAETVSDSADYHVFLTPRGDSKGLYVTNLTPTSFEVREAGGGTASIGFDYRIVAKRRGFEAQRLTDVTDNFKAETSQKKLLKRTITRK